jgi:amidohydrolase
MIEAGVLDNPRVDEVYGLHLTTLQPVGQVQVRPGPSMASADAFTVEVQGAGGHGAMPHLSIDPITAAANILLGMQALVAREVPAQDTAVLTVGQIVSGTKGNIIPDRAIMRGTLRAFEQSVRDHLVSRLGDFAADIAKAYRAEATTRFDGGSCPAVVNHAKETEFVRTCAVGELGAEAVTDGRVVMASDDMSLFLRERPGCYFRVGIASATGPARPHHAPEFEMNEAGLPVGLRVGLSVMRAALAR